MVRLTWVMLVMVTMSATGCSMCQSCFDEAYPHYGSIAPRTDRFHGRVGSRFAPAGEEVGTISPYIREADESQVFSPTPIDPSNTEPAPESTEI